MNRNIRSRICTIALALMLAAAALAVPAAALKVEGARIALDIEPGKTYTSPIGISISPGEPESSFAIEVLGFGQAPADGTYVGLSAAADTSPFSARPFITIDRPTVTLKPGERADVTATIAVPAGTRDGGRYAIILIRPAASASGVPAAFATAVAIPVFLTVKSGTTTETGEILTLEPMTAEPGKPFAVVTTFRNSGDYHYYGAVSSVAIADAQGAVVASATTEPFVRAIVPGQSVTFVNAFATGLPQGTYEVSALMEKQDGKLLAEKKGTLQVGNPAAARPTPGFGALAALMGLACALFGALRFRRGGEG